MKEFIEKLIERLEGLRGAESDKCKEYANLNMGDFLEKYNHGEYCYKNAISIVNELVEEYKPKTQADKIRSMSDEELAEFLSETELHGSQGNYEDYLKFLQSEAE